MSGEVLSSKSLNELVVQRHRSLSKNIFVNIPQLEAYDERYPSVTSDWSASTQRTPSIPNPGFESIELSLNSE